MRPLQLQLRADRQLSARRPSLGQSRCQVGGSLSGGWVALMVSRCACCIVLDALTSTFPPTPTNQPTQLQMKMSGAK